MIKFPFTSLQQFNLDWIMQQLHKILDFMPLNGVAGDVLQRTVDGAAWQPIAAVSMDIHSLNASSPDGADEIPIYDNDLAGNYKVTVQDVLDLVPPAPVDSVNGKIGTVVLDKDDIGLDNVDNVQQDSASNPPPYPVTSVNGQTGAVTVTGGVSSVNGQTGAVVLTASDVGALPDTYDNNFDVMTTQSECYRNVTGDITDVYHWFRVSISDNKKFLRLSGAIMFLTGPTSGWKYFDLYANSNLDKYDFLPPASTIEVPLIGSVFDENDAPLLSNSDMNLHNSLFVTPLGNLRFAFYQTGTTSGLKRSIIIPPVIVQTSK